MLRRDKITKELLTLLPFRSAEETEQYFQSACNHWDSSIQWNKIKNTLDLRPDLTVTKVVAFANASMATPSSPDRDEAERSTRSAYQHALMLSLKHHYGASEGYAQDPAYQDADIAVLHQHGIKVVHDPEGFL